MHFDEVRRRVEPIPLRLPQAPRALDPVLLSGPGGEPVRRPPIPQGPIRQGAVLVLLYPDAEGQALVLLTERATGSIRHSGEISFPGGAVEMADESLAAAALREAREEVGIDLAEVPLTVLGQLDPVEVQVSGFRLTPILVLAARRPSLRPDPREVAAIIEAPVSHFLPTSPIETVTAERAGVRLRYGAYPVAGHLVWGATARILGQLGGLLGAMSDEALRPA
ncbi:MAG: CoA pyrophosphatase [Chloroflexi bacterium]|nr:CoA pyrophosphatase [Chloroflexota bacterium]